MVKMTETNLPDCTFGYIVGLYEPLIAECRNDLSVHAELEASLAAVGEPLASEILTLRLWEFVDCMVRDAIQHTKTVSDMSVDDLALIHCRVIAWGRKTVIGADRATRIGIAILIGGAKVLEGRELHDLPDELVEYLPDQKYFRKSGPKQNSLPPVGRGGLLRELLTRFMGDGGSRNAAEL